VVRIRVAGYHQLDVGGAVGLEVFQQRPVAPPVHQNVEAVRRLQPEAVALAHVYKGQLQILSREDGVNRQNEQHKKG
jgi:hypothetical protein